MNRVCDTRVEMLDEHRLNALYTAHGQQVFRRALRLLGNRSDAEDVLQEVFVRAARHLDKLRSAEVLRWLYRTTTNYCLNLMRDRKRRRELLDEAGPPVSADTRTPEALMTLRALMANADERQARCVAYIYFDQISRAQAAELMGISVRTVGNLLTAFKTWAQSQTEVRP